MSGSSCPDFGWSLTLSGKHSRRPSSWRGWRTRPWSRRLFGAATWRTSTPPLLREWISSRLGSPARRSVRQGGGAGRTTNDGSGLRSPEWLATLAHSSCSSKTCVDCWLPPQASLLGSDTFCGTWPTSGSMLNGVVSRRPTSAPRTAGNGSSSWPTAGAASSWPTPTATNPNEGEPVEKWQQRQQRRRRRNLATLTDGHVKSMPLGMASRLWQTPSVADTTGGHATRGGARSGELLLAGQARQWPTPTAAEGQRHSDPMRDRAGPSLTLIEVGSLFGPPDQTTPTGGDGCSPSTPGLRRVLNPRFAEALMGLPRDWMSCERSVTESCRFKWRSRFTALLDELGFGRAE